MLLFAGAPLCWLLGYMAARPLREALPWLIPRAGLGVRAVDFLYALLRPPGVTLASFSAVAWQLIGAMRLWAWGARASGRFSAQYGGPDSEHGSPFEVVIEATEPDVDCAKSRP